MTNKVDARWSADCMKWRGHILTGDNAHWCMEWDDLPMDETCEEWPCGCSVHPAPKPLVFTDVIE